MQNQNKPKQQVESVNIQAYTVGKKVLHAKFGEGIIVGVKGSGDKTIAEVAFKGIGVKAFSVKYSPMKIL